MNEEDSGKLVRFLANQLLKEISLDQTIELVKYQAVQQSRKTFDKMTDPEKASLLEKLKESEADINE
jgi:predicted nucleic acid-binding protein